MNPTLQDENFTLRHDLPGVVTMGNRGLHYTVDEMLELAKKSNDPLSKVSTFITGQVLCNS
jgi:hypothetical protein